METMFEQFCKSAERINALDGHFLIEFLEDDQVICNCKVTEKCDAEMALDESAKLAEVAEMMLNKYYPTTELEWHTYSEPNYWGKDGEELPMLEDVPIGGTIQWCIFND